MPSVAENPVVQTELDNIFQRLGDLNSRLINNLQSLDKIGHRIKNTNFPTETAANKAEIKEPDGTLQYIQLQLDYYVNHNAYLESIIEKLSKLL